MNFFRVIAKVLLALMLLFDADLVYHIWKHPRLTELILKEVSPGVVSIGSRPIPVTVWDWMNLVAVFALNAILMSFLWLSRKNRKASSPL